MCLCYFVQRIDKISKYTGNEVVKENITGNTYKHNKINKEFTQYSWAMSPGLALSSALSIMFSKQIFYNGELNLSLTQQI